MADQKIVCEYEGEVLKAIKKGWKFTLANTLKELNLVVEFIGDEGAQSLSESLKFNSTLTSLTLAWNNIGSSGAQSLSESLKFNSTLTTLHLLDNNIG